MRGARAAVMVTVVAMLAACGSGEVTVGLPGGTTPAGEPTSGPVDLDEPQPGDEEMDDDLPEFEEEMRDSREASARADLRLDVVEAPTAARPGDTLTIVVTVTSLDRDFVNAPTLAARLPDGVAPPEGSDTCDRSAAELRCQVMPSLLSETGAVPVTSPSYELALVVAEDAPTGPAGIELWVESLDNPVDNEPDPTNNRASIELTIG